MKLPRSDRRLLAWMLYFSVLFSALACSIGHGQMAGLQLSGLDGLYCGGAASGSLSGELGASGAASVNPATGFSCALCATFMGLALAAFFGLLGLLPLQQIRPNPLLVAAGQALRYLWPSANPRASPII
ncbi:DUF2946 domain-containing protein [Pseudomonas sp.]|uniref:DUF2946 domain-containing protein n=1 Tax=Pseudomonas sp. TaxID=306 RepID=UPI0027330733|nr:DUF2946 domain-containing protein [Pseudomonas sp.]MDP3815586.1 DUF2946 domain-containing protein [Pseudomonas sp.]